MPWKSQGLSVHYYPAPFILPDMPDEETGGQPGGISHGLTKQQSMSKKNYIEIAAALRGITNKSQRYEVVEALSRVLASDNSRFSMERFYVACGLDPEQGGE